MSVKLSRRTALMCLPAVFAFRAAASSASKVLRIGYQKYGTLTLLKAAGSLETLLAQHHVKVQWKEFPGGPQLLEGLNVGGIDFGITGETPPIFAQAARADLVYVAYSAPAPAAEAILVREAAAIENVAQLKGKRVALNKGSNVHYLLVAALKNAGLQYADIQPVYMAPADARAAFERGSVDAWVIWDPYLAAAQAQLPVRVLRDGSALVNNHQFYLATRSYASQNPEVIELLFSEIRAIDQWAQENPRQVAEQVGPLIGLSPQITEVAIRRQGYGTQYMDEAVVAAQQKIADVFAELGLIPQNIDVSQVIWQPSR